MMEDNLPDLCKAVLKKLYGKSLEKYSVIVEGTGPAGEGYSNEMFYLNLKDGSENVHLVVKIMLDFKSASFKNIIQKAYNTEIHFYEIIWPALDKFQKENKTIDIFDKIPRYYGSLSELDHRALVMENLKASDFVLRKKDHAYDRKLIEFVFRNFGRFHGLSLALKDRDRPEFDRISSRIEHSWKTFRESEMICGTLRKVAEIVQTALNEEMEERISSFMDGIVQEYGDVTTYKGKNHVILHGDCWINNFLFKHNKHGEATDLRYLDFQMTQIGTPVYDLSYWFYSGALNEHLNDLDRYLKIYHNSLSTKLEEFGCDASTLYPIETLEEEWKQYCRFGFMMSLSIWRVKTSENVVDIKDHEADSWPIEEMRCDEAKYAHVVSDLVAHMLNNKFI